MNPARTNALSTAVCVLGLAVGAHGALADESQSREIRAAEAAGWSLEKVDDDPRTSFRLYSRPSRQSAFRVYRFESQVDASPDEACDAAMLYASSPERAAAGQHRTILSQAAGSILVHTHLDFPLVADREITTRIAKRRDEATGSCRLEWDDANDEGPPPVKGRVRIVASRGFWEFTPVSEESEAASMVYENYADLGGRIPGWLINSVMGSSIAGQVDDLRRLIAELAAAPKHPSLGQDPGGEPGTGVNQRPRSLSPAFLRQEFVVAPVHSGGSLGDLGRYVGE